MLEPRQPPSTPSGETRPRSGRPALGALLLALDSASPRVSVAVGRAGECLAGRSVELRRSSESLLRLVDEALDEAGVGVVDLEGILALRGPGSFTGLRVGLATVLGLHQALGVAATAVPTLPVVALAGCAARPEAAACGPVVAVVDALRGEWFAQVFGPAGPTEPLGEAEPLTPGDLAARRPALVAGFGAARVVAATDWTGDAAVWDPGMDGTGTETGCDQPESLASAALRLQRDAPSACRWDPATLTAPLYLRAPAVSLPKRRTPP